VDLPSHPARELWFGTRRVLRASRSPVVLGIVNVTPDSFSDGGRLWPHAGAALHHALQLIEDGADAVDIGGESTRPGAVPVTAEEELRRVLPLVEALRARTDVPISIDTTKAVVARAALDAGADVINDISGVRFDAEMAPLIAGRACSVIVMHMQGEPRTMQEAPSYRDVVGEVGAWLRARAEALVAAGIDGARLYVDPGIGFGKRLEDNLALLRGLDRLRAEAGGGLPLVIGASRKRFLGTLLDEPVPALRLEGDLAVAAHCHAAGVDVLRVHDVRAVRRLLRVLDALDPGSPSATHRGE
jgi:dihydropteroate synthase